jgi:hypothetical protein
MTVSHFQRYSFRSYLALCAFTCAILLAPLTAFALGDAAYVDTRFKRGSFILVGEKSQAQIYVDSNDYPGVVKATKDLQGDVEKVTGEQLALINSRQEMGKSVVIIGTIGKSQVIDRLITRKKIGP